MSGLRRATPRAAALALRDRRLFLALAVCALFAVAPASASATVGALDQSQTVWGDFTGVNEAGHYGAQTFTARTGTAEWVREHEIHLIERTTAPGQSRPGRHRRRRERRRV